MAPHSISTPEHRDRPRTRIGWAAIGFVLTGVLCILAPALVTLAATLLVAVALLIWGLLGLWMSLSFPGWPEWRLSASAYGLVALLGLAFVLFPRVGIEVMTLLIVAGFLIEGVFASLIAVRLSHQAAGWRWMAASGVVSLALGLFVLLGWPGSATWLFGLLIGVNFLTTGAALWALWASAEPMRLSGRGQGPE